MCPNPSCPSPRTGPTLNLPGAPPLAVSRKSEGANHVPTFDLHTCQHAPHTDTRPRRSFSLSLLCAFPTLHPRISRSFCYSRLFVRPLHPFIDVSPTDILALASDPLPHSSQALVFQPLLKSPFETLKQAKLGSYMPPEPALPVTGGAVRLSNCQHKMILLSNFGVRGRGGPKPGWGLSKGLVRGEVGTTGGGRWERWYGPNSPASYCVI